MPPVDPNDPSSKKPDTPDGQRAYESNTQTDRPAISSPTEGDLESQTPGGISAVHDPYAAWRFHNFRFYATGTFAWWIGRNMLAMIIGWHVYELTDSTSALGLVGLLEALPIIVLALPAGYLADRLNRKNMTIVMTVLLTLCTLAIAGLSYGRIDIPNYWILDQSNQALGAMASFLGEDKYRFENPVIPLLLLMFFLTGLSQSIGGPSRGALLASIIPIGHYSNAATWNSNISQIASMAGPAVGGLLLGLLSGYDFMYTVLYAAVAFCIAMFTVSLLQIRYTHKPSRNKQTMRRNISEGVRFVFARKIILAALTLDMFVVLLGGVVMILPVYAKDILEVGPSGLGWLRAAPALGAFIMALALAHLPPMKHAGRNLLLAVAGFAIAIMVFGVSKWFWLSLVALFFTGVFDNISVVIRHTLVQVLTPDSMRGRVSSVNNIFISTSNELGSFRAGISASIFGPVMAVAGGGVGALLVVIAVAFGWPEVRKFGSMQDARPEDE